MSEATEAKTMADGSKRFRITNGPHEGVTLRLYPSDNGWERFTLEGHVYVPDGREVKDHAKMVYLGAAT